ncbi:MAG: HAD family hydrolase, partial [Gemmatimonadales bacterium]
VLLYQLLHGSLTMATAMDRAAREPSDARHEWNRRYLGARAFLTSRLARFAAQRIPAPAGVAWTNRLFFLDLDGVFDSEQLGFPHTTTSGLASLALLSAHGVSVVVHTGRSIEDVHSYCRDYALPGGVGELGSVFLDAVAGREIPLVDEQDLEQLARCRDALSRVPGIFVDPTYRYAVRAYRITHDRTVPPPPGLADTVIQEAGLDRLRVSPSSVDVIVLARGVDKGRGLVAARDYLRCRDHPVAAIGDSDRDVPMLQAADLAFAPSGCSAGVRALSRDGRCRITAEPMQRGLLRAARDLASLQLAEECPVVPAAAAPAATPASNLIEALLTVAERPRLRRFLGALSWWGL